MLFNGSHQEEIDCFVNRLRRTFQEFTPAEAVVTRMIGGARGDYLHQRPGDFGWNRTSERSRN